MGIVEKIKDIEAEMARTQKNKATEHHLGLMKARLAKLRTQVFTQILQLFQENSFVLATLLMYPKLLEGSSKGKGGPGEGFAVTKSGDARVAMIGSPPQQIQRK